MKDKPIKKINQKYRDAFVVKAGIEGFSIEDFKKPSYTQQMADFVRKFLSAHPTLSVGWLSDILGVDKYKFRNQL